MTFLLAIDQGTTSSRAIIFDQKLGVIAMAQKEFPQHFPKSGWVEHEAEDIWVTVLATCRAALRKSGLHARDIAGIGITNQRETTLLWDRKTGKAVHRAIVWQDRRTSTLCDTLREQGHEPEVSARSGLRLDPYFSATKINWILETVRGARKKAEAGTLAFGTIDSFLIWRLTGGRVHATDATNASRTLLYNIHEGDWDKTLLDIFDVPAAILPEVRDSSGDFGMTDKALFGHAIPILAAIGDQQAAMAGQACFSPGMIKSTYGTGCFALLHTGIRPVVSQNRLLTTIALQLRAKRTYALEGGIFVAGASVQWLRDGLGIIRAAKQADALARAADPQEDVYLVPAFVGLGAPHWEPDVRGAIFGLTRNSGRAELVRAALQAVCFQTCDLLDAMARDWGERPRAILRVDGGLSASDWTMQALADIVNVRVERPKVLETTALGAAWAAGLAAGVCPSPAEFAKGWSCETRFTPHMKPAERTRLLTGWQGALRKTLA